MVIFGPICQVGCASACAGVTSSSSSAGSVAERAARRGEDQTRDVLEAFPQQALPDRRVLGVDRPQPIERVAAKRRPAAASTRWPPVTSVSLLASATRRPLRQRGEDGGQRGHPGGRDDHDLGAVERWRAPRAHRPPSAPRRGPSAVASAHQARASGHAASCAANSARRAPGGQPDQRESVRGARPRTSSVCRPIEPVEPSRTTAVTGCSRRPAARRRPAPARRRGTSRSGRGRRRGRGPGSPTPCGRPRA